jgi:cell division protein ZapA
MSDLDGAAQGEAVEVSIYGRTYQLRGSEDPAYLLELAALVDQRMREVAEGTGTAETLKVSILAGLNIADEYLQARHGGVARLDDAAERRLARMVTLLEDALVE